MSLRPRLLALAVAAAVAGSFAPARAQPTTGSCRPHLLILSAFPAELGPLLAHARIRDVTDADGRRFYAGTLQRHEVVMALTGIGLVNADTTTRIAVQRFGCGLRGIVFSGVSGGRTNIGDVTVPARWTLDGGGTWLPVDPAMLASANAASSSAHLSNVTPTGDPVCVGVPPDAVKTVAVLSAPRVIVGGDGASSDPFGGRSLPCAPGGGDVFGCHPCADHRTSPEEATRFVAGAVPLVDPAFFLGYFSAPPSTPPGFDADDMETAAVARVASQHGVPFIAFRALSDGGGDPLHLPGFPFQFFVYRQLAADNAAAVASAFLAAWRR